MNYSGSGTCSASRSPYVPIKKFGVALNDQLKTDPVGESVYRDVNTFLDIGPLARRYGPNTEESQTYMAQKCAENWDGACEFLSRNNDTNHPNVGKINSVLFKSAQPEDMTVGDYLVDNAATRRFCNMDSCAMTETLYNELDPTSPLVKQYGPSINKRCLPVCSVPENPDEDTVLNKVLLQPYKHLDLLLNLYWNTRNQNKMSSLTNTKIGKIFHLFDMYFQKCGKK